MVRIADDPLSFLSSAIIFTPRLQTWLSTCPSSVNSAPALNWPVRLHKEEHLGSHLQSSDFRVQLEWHSKSLAWPTRPTWPLPTFLISPPTNFLAYHTLHWPLCFPTTPSSFLPQDLCTWCSFSLDCSSSRSLKAWLLIIVVYLWSLLSWRYNKDFTGLSICITSFLHVQPHHTPLINLLPSIHIFQVFLCCCCLFS